MLQAIKIPVSTQMFFKHMEAWNLNNQQSQLVESMGTITLKVGCSDKCSSLGEYTMYIFNMHNERLANKDNCNNT